MEIKATSSSANQFIQSVLDWNPRLAVFDCDGTLWEGDSGMDFMYWTLDRHFVPCEIAKWMRHRYAEYKAGRVSEEDICGEMVQIYSGVRDRDLVAAAKRFSEEIIRARIFPQMLELAHKLHAQGCELWAVSSTNHWAVTAAVEPFLIAADKVLGASVEVINGIATHKLMSVPSGEAKATRIHEVIGRRPDAVFGNSIHDAAMLALAKHAVAVDPTAELAEIARQRGWTIYRPGLD